ncbi:Two component system response regulator/histidine kinase, PAS domain-containing [Desulfonema limicola]|uniref:histidine kinase n=1 Tax=Desulfonema limicola TaxID=45656 RepID=A0A975B8F4_9BACT|nr:PAS domain S-box protein [Desulfonema limicola]QTA80836.1 Two component system response regulator/histidine kinase, PAS domain-containing [Desulfonema limicola]
MKDAGQDKFKKLEWMLDETAPLSDNEKDEYVPPYGDVTKLNSCRLIMDSVGGQTLKEIGKNAIKLLDTSAAVYEASGDYAFGMFSSGWCRLMDSASRELCKTDDNQEALSCGRWLCHENCWNDSAKKAIETGRSTDIECVGGIHLYAEPIYAGKRVVGVINIGYGDPPKDPGQLQALADAFRVDSEKLKKIGESYKSRPKFIVDVTKQLLGIFAKLIGKIVEKAETEDTLRTSEEKHRRLFETMSQGVVYHSADGTIISANPAAEKILGLTFEQMQGKTSMDPRWKMILEDGTDIPGTDHPVMIALRTGETVGPVTRGVFHPEKNAYLWLSITAIPLYRSDENIPFQVYAAFEDITERKRAEEKLRKSERELQLTLNATADGIWSWNFKTNELYFSPKYYNMIGYEANEFPANFDNWLNLIHPDDREGALDTANKFLKTKPDLYENEFRLRTKSGDYRWARTVARVVERDENGDVVYMIGNHEDITERKLALDALIEERERFDLAMRSVNDGLWDWNIKTNEIYFSPVWKKLLGYEDHEIKNEFSAWERLTDPKDVKISWGILNEVLAGKRKSFENEFKMLHKDGRWVDILARANVFFDENGKGERCIGTHVDITERKKMEKALRLSEAKFRLAFKTSPDSINLNRQEDGVYIDINNGYTKIMGYHPEEVIGKSSLELNIWKNLQDRKKLLDGLNEKGFVENLEAEFVSKNGDIKYGLMSAIVTEIGGEKVILSITRDITERRQAEAERDKLQDQLIQAQKMESVGRLAGGVAHEFNNMLYVIIGNTEMAMEDIAPDDPLQDILAVIFSAARRSAAITRQLLAFARKQTIAPKVLDLNDTIENMLKMLRQLIGENIDLAWLPGANIRQVRMDPSQIDQILANLCINARDAITDIGKITIETGNMTFDSAYCEKHPGFAAGEFVLLAVSDNGSGMNKETMANLYEPFFTTKDVGKGTGLGLATVYGIVKQNKGFINVYSEPGQGTTFRIYLPQYLAETKSTEKKNSDKIDLNGNETILLVEDEPSILQMTRMMLEKNGYKVITASRPGEAIALAREHAGGINLLMTDVVMPEMNGRDLAGNILSLYPDLKCLFMSGYTENMIAHHGILDENVQFIQKPFSREQLGAKVREVLDEKKS